MSETTNGTTSGTTNGTTSGTGKTSKASRSRIRNYETRVGLSEQLLQVLQAESTEKLTVFGITPDAVKEFAGIIEKIKATSILQGEAKASLKTLSARLRAEQKQMESRFYIFKRKIKAEVPLEEWKRFGFDDKH